MQIIFQKADGSRVPLTQQAYDMLRLRHKKSITHLVREPALTILCFKGNETAQPPRSYKYGGTHKERMPFHAAMESKNGVRIVHNTHME